MLKIKNKEQLIRDFNRMADFEEWANEFYLQISLDPRINDKETKEIFQKIALDEKKHTEAVKKIINIIKNNL